MTQMTASLSGSYVKTNGLNMYYEEYGSGEPLVLLHGGTMTGKSFAPHISAFSERFRVITPDFRGHGQTDNPSGEFSYRLLADDMAAFMDALGLKRPSICGWSDGGQAALELGMHYPDLMRCMVVGASWFKFSDTMLNTVRSMGIEGPGVVNLEKIKQSLPQLAEFWSTLHSPTHSSDYWETLLTQISTMWMTPLAYTSDDFQKITAPTLILVGDRDEFVDVEEATEMYRFIQGAELAILPHSDHSLPESRAELFITTVLDFLLRHGIQTTEK
jgi:pimeloyl-ACP methyl ester carboxylesterase